MSSNMPEKGSTVRKRSIWSKIVHPFVIVGVLGSALVNPIAANAAEVTRYGAANGSGTSCTTSAPCSLNTAITNAPAGSTVLLKAGDYANTTITSGKATSSAHVTVKPATDGVVLNGLKNYANYVDFTGITVKKNPFYLEGNGTTFDKMHVDGTGLFVRANDLTITNSTFENGTSLDGLQIGGAQRVLVQNNLVKNYNQLVDNGLHSDCIQVFDSSDIVLKQNTLTSCSNAGIITSPGKGTGVKNLTVESNFVQGCVVVGPACRGGSSSDFRYGSPTNMKIVNNTFATGSLRLAETPGQVFDRNYVSYLSSCTSPMTNSIVSKWNTKMCSTPSQLNTKGNRAGTLALADEKGFDLHVTDFASATITPVGGTPAAVDIDGDKMPANIAGADAKRTATTTPTPEPTTPPVVVTPTPTPEPTTPPVTPTPEPTTPPVVVTPTPTPTPTVPTVDTTAPKAAIVTPVTNSTVRSGTAVPVKVNASDDRKVTSVTLWAGTTKVGSAVETTPGVWTYTASTTGIRGTIALTAKAADAAGNVGTSSRVTVNVQ